MDELRLLEGGGESPSVNPQPTDGAPQAAVSPSSSRPVHRYEPFPTDALPEPLRSFVSTGAVSIGCDPSFVALPCLSVVASCIGNARRIRLKPGWSEPAVIWTATVADPGDKKTPGHTLAMRPVDRLQREAFKRHREAIIEHNKKMLTHSKAMNAWKGKKSDADPPTEPMAPIQTRLFVSDTTVEALALILKENPLGLLLACDELSGWFGSFDRYAKGKGGDAAHWLGMWQAGSITVDRKTNRETIYIPRAAVSIAGNIQPRILDRVLGDQHRDNGLAARFLLAYPPPRACRWTETGISERLEDEYYRVVLRLRELQSNVDNDGELKPVMIFMMPDARAIWVDFYNAHNDERAELTGDSKAAWAKLEAYAARLAMVIHFVRWAADDPALRDPDRIDPPSVEAGIRLVSWFKNEANRLYGRFSETDAERARRRALELIHAKDGAVSVRDWQRLRHHATKSDAKAELSSFANAGLGDWEQQQPGQRGGRPSSVFKLYEACDSDKTTDSEPETGVLSLSHDLETKTSADAPPQWYDA